MNDGIRPPLRVAAMTNQTHQSVEAVGQQPSAPFSPIDWRNPKVSGFSWLLEIGKLDKEKHRHHAGRRVQCLRPARQRLQQNVANEAERKAVCDRIGKWHG